MPRRRFVLLDMGIRLGGLRACVGLATTALSAPVHVLAQPEPEPAVSVVVEEPPTRAPDAEFSLRLSAIERGAYAADALVARAVTRARAELLRLQQASAQAASPAIIQRIARVCEAALAWADRAEAQARARVALSALAARAQEAEREADSTQKDYERVVPEGAAP